MRPTLTTERLRLEPLTHEDTDRLVELDADPEVMRFVSGRGLTRAEVVDTWMHKRTRSDADARGIGYWVGQSSSSGEFMGWWCLGVDDADPGAAELGYRLRRTAWGQGYATEGSLALLEHGFGTIGLTRIWADTRPANTGSQRVLEKCGLSLVGTEDDRLAYEITRKAWLASAAR